MIVADTDVLIDFLAGVASSFERVRAELERGALSTTAITRFELLSGAVTPKQEARILDLLAGVPALPLDSAAADSAARVRTALERKGQRIGMADSLIAGIVLTHGRILMTRNRRHFERVPNLRIETPSRQSEI